jgi:16S rRNA processing protein RimM
MGDARFVTIGRVLKPKGLKGEVKVAPSGAMALDDFKGLEVVVLNQKGGRWPLHVESASHNNKFVYLKFESVKTVEEAEQLRNGLLEVEEDKLKPLPQGTFYQSELLGFAVRAEDGRSIGTVSAVVDYPSCDALEVRTGDGREILVPMTKRVIREISKDRKEITLFAQQIEELLQG